MGKRSNRAQANEKPLFQAAFLQFSANCDVGAYSGVRNEPKKGADKVVRQMTPEGPDGDISMKCKESACGMDRSVLMRT